MLINKTDIREYGAKLLTVITAPPEIKTNYEMIPKSLLPIEHDTSIPLGTMEIRLYFREKNRAMLERTLSGFMRQFRHSCVIEEIKGYKGKYKGYITGSSFEEVLAKEKKILVLKFEGYFFDNEESITFDGVKQALLHLDGSRDTPCAIEVTAKAELKNFIIELNGEAYTIKSLEAGKTIEINGKTGKVTQNGGNAFGSVDLWALPKLETGRNRLLFSSDQAKVTVRYEPMWL